MGLHAGNQVEAVSQKQNAMGHAHNFDSHGVSPDIFQGHGQSEQEQVGHALDIAEDAQKAEGSEIHLMENFQSLKVKKTKPIMLASIPVRTEEDKSTSALAGSRRLGE